MKTLPVGMQDHLDSGATTLCYCWKVTRQDGVIQGFTEHDENIEFDSLVYEASSGFTASQISQNLGLSVDNLNLDGALDSDTINEDDLASGMYDNADMELYLLNWQDVSQRVIMAKGSLGEVMRKETMFSAEFRSQAHLLNQGTGRTYQRFCDAILGGERCKVDLTSTTFKGTGSVVGVSGRNIEVAGLNAYDSSWFTYGIISFTSGSNSGLSFEVKDHSGDTITLWNSPPWAIEATDTFTITAGCAQDSNTCGVKFDNVVNFQGFHLIPGNDLLSKYPTQGEGGMNGGSLFS